MANENTVRVKSKKPVKTKVTAADKCIAELDTILALEREMMKRLTVIYKGRPELTRITHSAVKANLAHAEEVLDVARKNPETWPDTHDRDELELCVKILHVLNDMDDIDGKMETMKKGMRKCAGSISMQTANAYYSYNQARAPYDKKAEKVVQKLKKRYSRPASKGRAAKSETP